MRLRELIGAVATASAVLLIAAPAQGQTSRLAAITAADNIFTSDDGDTANVTIVAGGHVNFAYPFGRSRHNVVFTAALPTVCGSDGGPPATASALPGAPSGPGWDGGCDFQAPGTYPFVCALHSSMTGSVTVVAPGTAPPPPPPPSLAAAASSLRIATQQRGTRVRGSVRVARSGSRLLARAFVARNVLYGGRSRRQVQVGRQLRTKAGAKRVTFSTALSPVARRALRRRGKLLISLRLTVTPTRGKSYTARRTVILRPPRRAS